MLLVSIRLEDVVIVFDSVYTLPTTPPEANTEVMLPETNVLASVIPSVTLQTDVLIVSPLASHAVQSSP